MQRNRSLALIALWGTLLLPRAATAACDCSSLPTLGRAAAYPALGIGNILVELQGSVLADSATVDGNVGVSGPFGIVHVQGDAEVGGHVGHQIGSAVLCTPPASCPTKILDGIIPQDMSGPADDAIAASTAFAGLTTTQTYGALTGSTTISGNGCVNVIQINGDVDLGGNSRIRLSGTADDYFVVNVTGDLLTSGTADIELEGVDPSHVIFNLTTPGARVELAGDSGGNFTILNPAGEIYLHGNSGGRGAYYAGQTRLLFQGSADFSGEPFACGSTSCPDPELTGANIQTPATPQGRGTGNSSFFYAWFDLASYEGHLEHFRLAPDGKIMDEQGLEAIDSGTREFLSTRDPYFDAAIGLRTNTTRKIYTTVAGDRELFDNTQVSETDLGLLVGEISAFPNFPASGVDTLLGLRDAVIDYVHGQDAFDADGDADADELRPAVLGDIFHSNPLFIGTPTTLLMHEDGYEDFWKDHQKRDRVVYAGANDGLFHAFSAGAWYDPNDPGAFQGGTGEELFGYVPGLLLPSIKLVPRTDDQTGKRLAAPFVDGNIVAADAWLGDGSGMDIDKSPDEWATVVLAAFREGGRGYLALDATDPGVVLSTDPHYPYPKLLWEFTHSRMAESWSRPVITRVKLAGSAGSGDHCGKKNGDGDCREQWVAIFGAGYSTDGDPNRLEYVSDPNSLIWSDRGKAIFMVALDSGQVLASVAFDASGADGHAAMKYSIPSQPAVLDLNGDLFADVVLIGDTAGQLWKWDLSAKGVDSDADPLIDNWPSGLFFEAPVQDMGNGSYHYRSFYFPPSAAWVSGSLTYAFGTGERRELLYPGDVGRDDNNRLYVVRDPNPTGASAIPASPYTEANLTDVTATATDADPSDLGFYIVAPESEKFVTDVLIFAGYAIAASYEPDAFPTCGAGKTHLYAFRLFNALGLFDSNATPEASDRHVHIGAGVPSTPRISVAPNPGDDIGFINTSDKKVLDFEPPPRDDPEASLIYWKQEF